MKRTLFFTLILGALTLMTNTILSNNSIAAHTRSALSLEHELKNPVKVTNGGQLDQTDFFFNKPANTSPTGKSRSRE